VHAISVEERRARLARRHRLAPGTRAGDAVEAARSLVCLHATTPSSVYLSAWARVDGFTVAAMDKALYSDRDLVKHLAMRRTLFVFPTDALGAVQAGASARVGEAESRRLVREVERAGLHSDGTAWLARAGQAVLEALADGRELTSTELREEIPLLSGSITYGAGKSWGGQIPVGPRVLTILSARGQVVRASNDGPWTSSRPRWATMRSWTGRSVPEVDRSAGVATLVRRWLAAFGPGTLEDIKWWLGGTVAATRRALVDVGAVEVALGGKTGFVLPDDVGRTRTGRALGRAASRARPGDDGVVRPRLVPPRSPPPALRLQRQRGQHRLVGRSRRRWVAPVARRGGRRRPARGRRT
jgi:hypothetical protein